MKKSIEVRCKNIDSAFQYLDYDIEFIGIGSESCIHKLPDVKDVEKLMEAMGESKKIKVILPFVPQVHIEKVKKYILNIVKLGSKVTFVVNDYGILYYISNLKTDLISVNLGRFLERSIDLIPWKKNLLRSESEINKKILQQSSFSHEIKLDFFKNMKVKGIETSLSNGLINSFDVIKSSELDICVHYKNNTMAFTRACPVRRYFNDENSCYTECASKCNELFELEFWEKWDADNAQRSLDSKDIYVKDQDVKSNYPKLYVSGNVVLREYIEDIESIDDERIDCIILDEYFIKDIKNTLNFFNKENNV